MNKNNKYGNNIYIWGTGHNSKLFMLDFEVFRDSNYCNMNQVWENCIAGFIDMNDEKQGTMYMGKPVVSCEHAMIRGMDYCIITVEKKEEIESFLKKNGFEKNQFVFWKDFIKSYKRGLICNSDKIILEYWLEKRCYSERDKEQVFFNEEDRLIRYLFFSECVRNKKNRDDEAQNRRFLEKNNPNFIVDALHWYFEDDIEDANEWISTYSFEKKRRRIKTIALVVDKLYAGGIERFVSVLCGVLVKGEVDIVVITDYEMEGLEYSLPKKVIRYNMTNKYNGCLEKRYEELAKCIKEFNIDCVCYNTGYARLITYYELLFLRFLGVYSTIGIHSAFIALISDHKEISDNFHIVYKMADRVITLTKADYYYWSSLGCDCSLIPNPIDPSLLNVNPNHNYRETNQKVILWVGRIVQRPKQVLEIVSIMRLVKEKKCNAILKVKGSKDDLHVYNKLVSLIKENELEEYIIIDDYQTDIEKIYENADFLLMTSASECSPNVILEAEAFGLPIIMYDIPWLEMVVDGKGCVCVKQGDAESVSNAIVEMCNNEKLRKRYSNESREQLNALLKNDTLKEWKELFFLLQNNKEKDKCMDEEYMETIRILNRQFYNKGYPF